MGILEVVVLAVALSADCLGVAAAVGIRHRSWRQIFRLPFHFGLFQALMATCGAIAGSLVLRFVESWDHWVICAILAALGAKMIVESRQPREPGGETRKDLTKGWSLVGLSVAVSLDAMGAGLGLSVAKAPMVETIVAIGLASWIVPTLGMVFAGTVEKWLGRKAELIAGIVLVALGVKTVFDHLS